MCRVIDRPDGQVCGKSSLATLLRTIKSATLQEVLRVTESFDVIRIDSAGPLWIGTASTFTKAVEHARRDMDLKGACEYIVLNTSSGAKTILSAEQLHGQSTE